MHAKDTEEQVSLIWFVMQWTQNSEISHQTARVILDFRSEQKSIL